MTYRCLTGFLNMFSVGNQQLKLQIQIHIKNPVLQRKSQNCITIKIPKCVKVVFLLKYKEVTQNLHTLSILDINIHGNFFFLNVRLMNRLHTEAL